MFDNLKNIIENVFLFSPNRNQLAIIERLIFEIIRREQSSTAEIIDYLKNSTDTSKYSGNNKFLALKNALMKKRFPITYGKKIRIDEEVFLSKIKKPFKDNWQVEGHFKPIKIFVEREVKDSFLLKNFQTKFADVEVEELDYYSEYLKREHFRPSQLKKPLIFIIKEKWDFIKRCPCTKHHLSCGYWVLNIGFGCPFDCSYCFIQQYTNFPGILLPANIEDFFEQFDQLYNKLKSPIRIGTGEFCDSLALDNITGYSKKLIPYFQNKNIRFELKTKSASIDNVLTQKPSANITISWSLTPPSVISTQEFGTASLEERLESAKIIKKSGFGVGFHFDPIIHANGWEKAYYGLIEQLYSSLTPPFSWISLGTLRCHRELKSISEKRFPASDIFYGELFLGEDKKLRYPPFLRSEIYKKITEKIRQYDAVTPVYLCMENRQIWKGIKGLVPFDSIEESLIK